MTQIERIKINNNHTFEQLQNANSAPTSGCIAGIQVRVEGPSAIG